jgi:hypothetical protein
MNKSNELDVQLSVVAKGFDGKKCWVHVRGDFISDDSIVLTGQKLSVDGQDLFQAIHSTRSDDRGTTWTPLTSQNGFAPNILDDESKIIISDFYPKFHKGTQTLLGTGHSVMYKKKQKHSYPHFQRRPVYAVYDLAKDSWRQWRAIELPKEDEPLFYNCGSGSVQRWDNSDGTVFLPIYCKPKKGNTGEVSNQHEVCVLKCAFDGAELRLLEYGNFLSVDAPRGLGEPSIIQFKDHFYLTLRNDEKGYVAFGEDGVNFSKPIPWRFEDGAEIGNYNTQQHWLTLNDKLFLVYTRKGLQNNHVFRHRAPLMITEFDPERLCLLKETETIVVPERGARLGNFGVINRSNKEAFVIVSEWMQGLNGSLNDIPELLRRGADNSIFLAKLTLR